MIIRIWSLGQVSLPKQTRTIRGYYWPVGDYRGPLGLARVPNRKQLRQRLDSPFGGLKNGATHESLAGRILQNGISVFLNPLSLDSIAPTSRTK